MAETGGHAPKIRKPERSLPWGLTIIVVGLVTAMAIFGTWGFVTLAPLTGVVNSDDGLNIRAEPDINSERTGGLASAEEVNLTGVTHVLDGETWYELDSGGWVLGEFLDITGG